MSAMRRAVLAMLLCVAPLVAAPAHASNALREGEQLRAVEGRHAIVPLPLHTDVGAPPSSAPAGALAGVARGGGWVRVLGGVRDRAALPAVRALLERLGARPESFDSVGVLSATVPDGA